MPQAKWRVNRLVQYFRRLVRSGRVIGGGGKGMAGLSLLEKRKQKNVFAFFKSSLFSTLYGFEGLAWQKLLFLVSA
ncbi:hypothetical protein [Acidiphilium acidophilum]|uniref:hypothetical protein n=1 Tax=Acidiphilium acidophilum TaxID=76588 RepID=UPI002E8E6FB8|nr:hypothetical protein [Acidiphilium acidophilum]